MLSAFLKKIQNMSRLSVYIRIKNYTLITLKKNKKSRNLRCMKSFFSLSLLFQIEVTSLCMCVSISSTVALFCLFAPKVYIVLCQPHKNVRQRSAPSVQVTATTKSSRRYSAQAGSNGAQNGSIHREVQCTERNVFPDSVEENSSCDEGVAMRAPSSCAS